MEEKQKAPNFFFFYMIHIKRFDKVNKIRISNACQEDSFWALFFGFVLLVQLFRLLTFKRYFRLSQMNDYRFIFKAVILEVVSFIVH